MTHTYNIFYIAFPKRKKKVKFWLLIKTRGRDVVKLIAICFVFVVNQSIIRVLIKAELTRVSNEITIEYCSIRLINQSLNCVCVENLIFFCVQKQMQALTNTKIYIYVYIWIFSLGWNSPKERFILLKRGRDICFLFVLEWRIFGFGFYFYILMLLLFGEA